MSDFYYDKLRHRQYSLASLREKIEDQFNEETSGRSDILSELDTRAKRIAALGEVADFVLANDYIDLPSEAKKQIIQQAVSNLFYFGELDPLLQDDSITEISIEGLQPVLIRRVGGETQKIPSPIQNLPHLERLLTRLIAPAQTALLESHPFIEVGLQIYQRPVRVSIIAPPVNPMYSVEIRLHPAQALRLKVPPSLAEALQKGRGLIVTGEVGAGKTSFIEALLPLLEGVVLVERAAEMRAEVTRLAAIPPHPSEDRERDFATQIRQAIQYHQPRCLVLDEIRGDEAAAFWDALSAPEIPQLIIAFRGSANPARLLSALSMVIRKTQPQVESETLHRLILEKLPLVALMQKTGENPQLSFLGEWLQGIQTLNLAALEAGDIPIR